MVRTYELLEASAQQSMARSLSRQFSQVGAGQSSLSVDNPPDTARKEVHDGLLSSGLPFPIDGMRELPRRKETAQRRKQNNWNFVRNLEIIKMYYEGQGRRIPDPV